MDPVRFDRLAKTLSTSGTRRGLLRLLATAPVASGLLTLLEPEDAQGRGEDGRDGKDGRDGRDGKGGKTRACNAEPRTKTCRDRCGPVRNNCGQRINCGSCGTCRADTIGVDCDCPPNVIERQCVSNPGRGERLPSCVCDRDFCRFDGPLSGKPTACCSCTPV